MEELGGGFSEHHIKDPLWWRSSEIHKGSISFVQSTDPI